jgi:hypothetical protein
MPHGRPPYACGTRVGHGQFGRRGKAADTQCAVEEDGGDVGTVQRVLHVAVDLRQVVHLGLQLRIERISSSFSDCISSLDAVNCYLPIGRLQAVVRRSYRAAMAGAAQQILQFVAQPIESAGGGADANHGGQWGRRGGGAGVRPGREGGRCTRCRSLLQLAHREAPPLYDTRSGGSWSLLSCFDYTKPPG